MKKILIADDSMFMRRVLLDTLSHAGEYRIVEADSGDAAVMQFEKERPDLTFLDVIMPAGEEEGLRVLEVIKKRDPQAIVVMITAVGQDAVIERCKKLGAREYILKPFDEKQVVAVAKRCLSADTSHSSKR